MWSYFGFYVIKLVDVSWRNLENNINEGRGYSVTLHCTVLKLDRLVYFETKELIFMIIRHKNRIIFCNFLKATLSKVMNSVYKNVVFTGYSTL